MSRIAASVTATIGNTPLVELSRITAGIDGRILLKLEYMNPGHSKKDRAALCVIEEAEVSGDLQPGQTGIELTSGNIKRRICNLC
jgi:cysteine synthase A